jgi:hypothetical protein
MPDNKLNQNSSKLQTDLPLSEKDEVKKAENRTAKAQKGIKESVKADLKNRKK